MSPISSRTDVAQCPQLIPVTVTVVVLMTTSIPYPHRVCKHADVGAVVAASATMRVLVQRVTSAAVRVDGEVVGEVRPAGQGLLALVGVTHDDDASKAQRMAEKLWQLRILDDEKSASDVGAPILVVSQFTLYANTAKGRRPAWNAAAPRAVAEPLVTSFAEALRAAGRTGADRRVRGGHAGRARQRRPRDGAARAVTGCGSGATPSRPAGCPPTAAR